MFDDPVAGLLWGSETYRRTREGILRTVSAGRAAELLDMLTSSMRTAYLVGRADERRGRAVTTIPLATLDGMLPPPCCCRLAEGRHCAECHGGGHTHHA
jgi:hypothetical protein